LSGGPFGTGRFEAASASAPYASRRPLPACRTDPVSARQAVRSTFHCCAAASISISRAAAAARRSSGQLEMTLSLPPVFMSV
jgi:hypothetical protein